MLVFAGVVKKCLQHGHSFRLAGVWLKSENLRFACAVTRFCSSRVKTESYQGGIHSSSFFLFLTLAVPERLWQRRCHSLQQGSVVTPCPAVGPSVLLLYTFCFFVEHRRGARNTVKKNDVFEHHTYTVNYRGFSWHGVPRGEHGVGRRQGRQCL